MTTRPGNGWENAEDRAATVALWLWRRRRTGDPVAALSFPGPSLPAWLSGTTAQRRKAALCGGEDHEGERHGMWHTEPARIFHHQPGEPIYH